MYVCMCVCMYVCVCVYVCVCMYVCMYICMYVCMYVCMYDCMIVCVYGCMYAQCMGSSMREILCKKWDICVYSSMNQENTHPFLHCIPTFTKSALYHVVLNVKGPYLKVWPNQVIYGFPVSLCLWSCPPLIRGCGCGCGDGGECKSGTSYSVYEWRP